MASSLSNSASSWGGQTELIYGLCHKDPRIVGEHYPLGLTGGSRGTSMWPAIGKGSSHESLALSYTENGGDCDDTDPTVSPAYANCP
jgi:hypothetical protein